MKKPVIFMGISVILIIVLLLGIPPLNPWLIPPTGSVHDPGGAEALTPQSQYGTNGRFLAPIVSVESLPDFSEYIAVSDRAGLEAIRDNLHGKFYLTADIDLSGEEWTPIGVYIPEDSFSGGFMGILDGQGHVIKNLRITGYYEKAGLFGYIENATIENVGLEGTSINIGISDSTLENNPTYPYYFTTVGGICGYTSASSIINCYNTGDITAYSSPSAGSVGVGGICAQGPFSTIRDCYNTGAIRAYGVTQVYVGGICGGLSPFSSSISNCFNTGSVYATTIMDSNLVDYAASVEAGGICGGAHGAIRDCYNTGGVHASSTGYAKASYVYAGGICGGYYGDSIRSSYNTGGVFVASDSSYENRFTYAGGISGFVQMYISKINNTKPVEHSYWMAESPQAVNDAPRSSIFKNAFKLDRFTLGYSRYRIVLGSSRGRLTSNQMKEKTNFAGFDFETVWNMATDTNNGYPYLWDKERLPTAKFTINATADPAEGGAVYWGRSYYEGDNVTLYAWPNSEYSFDGWYENGQRIDAEDILYSFTASSDRTLQARFVLGATSEGGLSGQQQGGSSSSDQSTFTVQFSDVMEDFDVNKVD